MPKLMLHNLAAREGWIPTRSATPSTALVPQRKVGFLIPNAGLLLGFQGTKMARRGGISSPFSDAVGCTSPQNSGFGNFNMATFWRPLCERFVWLFSPDLRQPQPASSAEPP